MTLHSDTVQQTMHTLFFESFSQNGGIFNASLDGAFGGISVTSKVPGTLSIILGWHFPNRDHYGQTVGNQYAKFYEDAADAAMGNQNYTSRSAALADIVDTFSKIHDVFYKSSLPSWLSSQLVNSVSHIRTAMWFSSCSGCHKSNDTRLRNSGFWRQWEAFDCPDLDSIHNDGERHVPYISFFPDSTRSKMAAWAGNQQPNGMLAEQIRKVDPDTPEGRIMADSSSMFIMYVLELWNGDADEVSLKLYYPTVKRAALWHMSTVKDFDLPRGLETTYDILGFPKYEISAYSSAFHMMAMKAAAKLARVMGDDVFAQECDASLTRAQVALDTLSWMGTYYSAASSNCTRGVGCGVQEGLFADAFYAQVLSHSAGLGDLLLDPSKLQTHLETTAKVNCAQPQANGTLAQGCPNGLIALVGRSPPGPTDHQIWQMANHDWVALRLRSNVGAEDISDTLELSKRSVQGWSEGVKDQWNTAGISDSASYPTVTSHYGYHMTSWHIPLALSGQNVSLPSGELRFEPIAEPPYTLPFYFTGKLGSILLMGMSTLLRSSLGRRCN